MVCSDGNKYIKKLIHKKYINKIPLQYIVRSWSFEWLVDKLIFKITETGNDIDCVPNIILSIKSTSIPYQVDTCQAIQERGGQNGTMV